MKVFRHEKEKFKLEFRYDDGYQYLPDDSYEYGIRENDDGELRVICFNRSASYKGVIDEGSIEEFHVSLKELAEELKRLDAWEEEQDKK